MSGTALGCILAAVFISISVAPGLAATFPDQLHLGSGAFKAHSNVTFKELSLRTRPGGQDPTEGCVFVAELLHSRRAGWAIVLHHEGAGNHYYLGRGEEGDPPAEDSTMELLMEAAVRLLEDDLPPATEIAPGRRSVRAELNEGLVEALMTYPAPHSPVWYIASPATVRPRQWEAPTHGTPFFQRADLSLLLLFVVACWAWYPADARAGSGCRTNKAMCGSCTSALIRGGNCPSPRRNTCWPCESSKPVRCPVSLAAWRV
jgi:hypothetical protein